MPHAVPCNTPKAGIQLAIFLIGLFAFLQVYSIQAILPVLKAVFLASSSQLGLSVAMTVIAIALVSPFIGIVSDKFGRKFLIVSALAFMSVPTFLISYASQLYELNLWRFLQGLCVPAMTVVCLAYLSEEFPHHIAKLTAIYVAGTVLGGFLGRFLLGYLHELVGYQTGFIIMSAVTLFGAMIVQWLLPASQHFAKASAKSVLPTLSEHSKNPAVIRACLLGACVLFSLVGCFTFINLHLAKSPYFLSPASLGNIFAVYLIGVVITPLSARLIGRIGTRLSIVMAIFLSMAGLFLTLATPLWLIVVGLCVMSSGVFVTQTATISYMTGRIHTGRSLGLGLYYMTYYAGGSIGAWLSGVVYGLWHWTGVVVVIFLVQVLGLLIVAKMD